MVVNGNARTDKGYKDVILNNDYFVVIDDANKFNIGFSGSDVLAFATSPIDIGTDYKNDYTITGGNGNYTITIKSTNKTYNIVNYSYMPEEISPESPTTSEPTE